MSAARPLPEVVVAHTVTINNQGIPDHQGLLVSYQDTITFYNNYPQAVTIKFAPNLPGLSVWGNDIVIPNGTHSGFTAPNYDCAANYSVYINAAPMPGGPYAIQVGNGRMFINITNNYSSPDPVVIPLQGNIEMYSSDNSYQINWPGCPNTGGPFSTVLNQVVPGVQNNTAHQESLGLVQNYSYTIPSPGPALGNGGGKVRIVSS